MRKRTIALSGAILLLFMWVPGQALAAGDTTPPTTPGNFRLTAATATSVTLAWNPSTDNVGVTAHFLTDNFGLGWDPSTDNTDAQSRLLYRFYVNGVRSGVSSWVIGVTSNVGRTVLEAPAEGINSFTVDAVDTSGNASAQSEPFQLNNTDC
ncbi:hypothetical protein [Rhizocola hellebori]|nr:hypothetical protein [Rhizocola hellebori]